MRDRYPDLNNAWLAMMTANINFEKYLARKSVVDSVFGWKRYKRNLIKIDCWAKTYIRKLEDYHFLYKLYM